MICPTCGTHIEDGVARCPACHANVTVTVAMPALMGRWCPRCGVAVGWQDAVCENCGTPLEGDWEASTEQVMTAPDEPVPPEVPSPEVEADETQRMARIESAIPSGDDPTSKVAGQDALPRTGRLVLAAVASIALAAGLALALTHPWSPGGHSIGATEEADTSMAGFPGTVEALSGQDSDASGPYEVLSGDDATFAQLDEAYGKLGSYRGRAEELEDAFEDVAFGEDAEERTQQRRRADLLAIDVSNLIDALGRVDVTSGVYLEDRDHLLTLASWLRNWVDTLAEAYAAAATSEDVHADRDRLVGLLEADHGAEGENSFRALFDESYETWRPEHREG